MIQIVPEHIFSIAPDSKNYRTQPLIHDQGTNLPQIGRHEFDRLAQRV
jgi:hypothetical protein